MELPPFGLGTHQLKGQAAYDAVRSALQCGYRLIDTAAVYRNEAEVGRAIIDSGVPREELFVTTKLMPRDQRGGERVRAALLKSLEALQLRHVDCYMMHWPATAGKPPESPEHRKLRVESWKVMEQLQREGLVRFLGVSNFLSHHCASLAEGGCEVTPYVNQIELHPLCQQSLTVEYCRTQNILVQAYSPLGSGELLRHEIVREVLPKETPTAVIAELVLGIGLERQYDSYVVKSATTENIAANWNSWRKFSHCTLNANPRSTTASPPSAIANPDIDRRSKSGVSVADDAHCTTSKRPRADELPTEEQKAAGTSTTGVPVVGPLADLTERIEDPRWALRRRELSEAFAAQYAKSGGTDVHYCWFSDKVTH